MNHNEIGSYFTTGNSRNVSALTDSAPQWLQDVVYELHVGPPSDELYAMIHAVADSLSEYDELNEDVAFEIGDSLAEYRTHALWQWASSTEGVGMVNEYLSEIGSINVSDMSDMTQMFIAANAMAYTRIASALIYAILENE